MTVHPTLHIHIYTMNRTEYASIREAARVLGCTEAEVAGRVPVTAIASRQFVEVSELEAVVDSEKEAE